MTPMSRPAPLVALTLAALALVACGSPADEPVDATLDPATPVAAAASHDVTPTTDADWANPDAPDLFKFMATDLISGEQIDGTDLLYKDVVLWFWAPWCPICDAEAGALVNAMKEFPPDVTVLGIAGLGDVPTSETFIADHPGVEQFAHIYDEDGSIWQGFKVTGQPTLVLINQDGESQSYSGGYGKNDIVDKVAWLAEG
ncbi:redoxin domain-containing protein [Demequina sp. TTPB684]|uniref:redoxin domain-containing protein n=1 Tax=unclassified Demequina TaxID=2620311 RepID=UPI001CF45D9F|nr:MULTISPECIES: redoxin domain-containing protein [unclassified Demequina]MCB2413422.1 redoxin domain-containing protein [Demequina sp. TTPB684]UPU87985.1 redoxin domain-containing protein [Demequina sp. TMPB413]